MACCAFAVFLLSQLLLPVRTAARWLGLSGHAQSQGRPVDAAVAWQPGAAALAASPALPAWQRPGWRRGRIFATIVAIDLLLVGLLAQTGVLAALPQLAPEGTRAAAFEQALHSSICGARGWVN